MILAYVHISGDDTKLERAGCWNFLCAERGVVWPLAK